MAFDSLSERLQSTLKKVSGQGQLTESNMEEIQSGHLFYGIRDLGLFR